ncbi:MAG: DUF3015 family protein [Bacteriovoracia bacterium]
MRKLILVFMCASLALEVFAIAANSGHDTSDGCGLGWQVTDKKTWLGTTTRGTTNAFVPPTFGMTTGTIGCDRHPIAKNEKDAAVYVVNNMESLSVEMAQGQGEFLTAFAQTMGCADTAAFGRAMQSHYSDIMKDEGALNVFDNIKAQIRNDAALAANCNII